MRRCFIMSENTFNERPHKNEKQESITYVKALVEQARNDAREDDIPKLEKLIELLNSKKYGLVWEQHKEIVEEEMKTKIPVFVEDESKKIHDNPGSEDYNFLLEGDNLHSLHLLEKTHTGKIDVIYIDPPYNTGNKDFKYNDVFVDNEDTFRHSKWLSFMERRLRVAQLLLSNEGVIFIQINDIEVAQLKSLCDEIFGEMNFLNMISINMKNIAGASGGGEDKRFKKNCEYILIYAKDYGSLPLFNNAYEYEEIFEAVTRMKEQGISWKYNSVLIDSGRKEYVGSTLDGSGDEIKIFRRTGIISKSIKQVARDEEISEKEVYYKYMDKIYRTTMPQSSIRPRAMEKWNQLNIGSAEYVSIEYVPKSGKNKGKLLEQFYSGEKFNLFAWLSDVTEEKNGNWYKKTLQGTYWDFTAGTKNLTKEGNVKFANGKKPVSLLKQIVSLYPFNDITVLDFFAGSGTTGDAVIRMNSEDGGTRCFIMATNNEVIDTTFQRMKNVSLDFPLNLKYFKTDFIIKEDFPDVSLEYELLKYITPLVELEFAVDIANPRVQIVLNENQLEKLIEDEQLIRNSALFMHPDVFRDAEQNQILNNLQIKVQEIPNYFFGKELWSK